MTQDHPHFTPMQLAFIADILADLPRCLCLDEASDRLALVHEFANALRTVTTNFDRQAFLIRATASEDILETHPCPHCGHSIPCSEYYCDPCRVMLSEDDERGF